MVVDVAVAVAVDVAVVQALALADAVTAAVGFIGFVASIHTR